MTTKITSPNPGENVIDLFRVELMAELKACRERMSKEGSFRAFSNGKASGIAFALDKMKELGILEGDAPAPHLETSFDTPVIEGKCIRPTETHKRWDGMLIYQFGRWDRRRYAVQIRCCDEAPPRIVVADNRWCGKKERGPRADCGLLVLRDVDPAAKSESLAGLPRYVHKLVNRALAFARMD